jgi:hypothetical protein
MASRFIQSVLVAIAGLLVANLVRPVLFPTAAAQPPVTTQDVVRAKSFELVSANGQVVAQLYTGEDGGGQLRLRSGGGVVRVKLGATEEGSGLILMDRNAEPAVWLAVTIEGSSVTLAEQGKSKRVLTP